ncbi:MAG: hypothetical protein N3E39_02875 [Candidatus Methanomethylicia archaeon]|nr:hypothetical protein [Candidatus Methanomethylicia archaeon]
MYSNEGIVKVILTHDVDWSIHGPGKEHILARRDRFSDEVILKVIREGYNPYFNIPELMDLEDFCGVRSTFFFRCMYDDGSTIESYGRILKELIDGEWEIGVHINNSSTLESMILEKKTIEDIVGIKVYGSRVHNLDIEFENLPLLYKAGFKYDSSITFNKYDIDIRNTGCLIMNGLIVFPITIMDTYLFTYMRVSEDKIINVVNRALDFAFKKGYMTILWHDCSLKMKGGRIYPKILEFLVSKDNVEIVRGIDAYRFVKGDLK